MVMNCILVTAGKWTNWMWLVLYLRSWGTSGTWQFCMNFLSFVSPRARPYLFMLGSIWILWSSTYLQLTEKDVFKYFPICFAMQVTEKRSHNIPCIVISHFILAYFSTKLLYFIITWPYLFGCRFRNLQQNYFTGPLPSFLGELTALQQMWDRFKT